MHARPRLCEYRDFRAFLRAFYACEKARDPAFSYGVFARRAGLANRGHLKLVSGGKRDLTPPMVRKYVRGLGLGPTDAEYFGLLVSWNQAGPEDEGAAHAALNKWITEQKFKNVPIESLGPDLHMALLLMGLTFLKGFRDDPAWIRSRLLPQYSEERIRRALDWLLEGTHLLRRRGRLVRGQPISLSPTARDAPLLYGPFLRYAAETGLRQGGHRAVQALLVLSEAQVKECGDLMVRWLREQVLSRPPPAEDGRLHVILGGIFPLTKP